MARNAPHFLKEHKDQLRNVLNFFCSSYLSRKLEKEKRKFCSEKAENSNISNYQFLIGSGWFSLNDYFDFHLLKDSIKYEIIEPILSTLCERGILIYQSHTSGLRFYKPNSHFFKIESSINNIINHLIGFSHVIENFKNSVYKIEVRDKKGDTSLGTGFLASEDNRSIVITNKHVVENQKLTVYDIKNVKHNIESVTISDSTDIAKIILNEKQTVNHFEFSQDIKVLDGIITMGYPIVPMSRDAYLLCHSGEINSFIEHYNGSEYFIFSAKTSSGNSGSPVVDSFGRVVGMITEELFEEKQFFSKGKLPYYAAIPSKDIISFLNSKSQL